jgi:DinB superfamily
MSADLQANHQAFVAYISSLSEQDFHFAPAGKWTAGQQLEHIYKSLTPLTKALKVPSFLLKWNFGTANRPSRTYDEVVARYKDRLLTAGVAPARFAPAPVRVADRDALAKKVLDQTELLIKQSKKFSEKQLDTMILPHPLLGKVTLREMFHFTAYHVVHHHQKAIENLKGM